MLVAAEKQMMLKMKAKTAEKTMSLALTCQQATLKMLESLMIRFVGAPEHHDVR